MIQWKQPMVSALVALMVVMGRDCASVARADDALLRRLADDVHDIAEELTRIRRALEKR